MILRLVVSALLLLASTSIAPPAALGLAQDGDDTAPAVEDMTTTDADDAADAGEGDEDAGTADEAGSNLPGLLVGAVLLSGGVWAYMNKKKRFPGTAFRE